ncbi:MAG TPA: glycosyltransferase family 4 protein [Nitrospira sp.]|nr:glycosyltransferase family 4 protein [Nitrospira sp.]
MARPILYIHGVAAVGGAERDLLAILRALDRPDWEPHVACPSEGQFSNLMGQAGVVLHPMVLPPWRKWFSPFVRWLAVNKLRILLEQLKPALIHVNDIWWVPQTLEAVRGRPDLRIPVVAHVRQEIEPEKVGRYRLQELDAVIAISRHVERALIAGGVDQRTVRTIYSGIDRVRSGGEMLERTTIYRSVGLPDEAVLLGTVAHLFPRKGYDVMLKALPSIIRTVPAVHYVVIGTGDGGYEQRLRELSAELGISDHVHFVGFQQDVNPFLEAMSLYVHPARMEGFGIAVVEALAAGKAVVATNVGGLPEVVEEGDTGLLVAPDDSQALTAAVLSLLRDDGRRRAMGERAVKWVRERFDLRASVRAMERFYQDVLSAHRNRT